MAQTLIGIFRAIFIDRVLGQRFLGSRSLGFPIDLYIYIFFFLSQNIKKRRKMKKNEGSIKNICHNNKILLIQSVYLKQNCSIKKTKIFEDL